MFIYRVFRFDSFRSNEGSEFAPRSKIGPEPETIRVAPNNSLTNYNGNQHPDSQ